MSTLAEEVKALADKHIGPLKERREEILAELSKIEGEIDAAETLLSGVTKGSKRRPGPAGSSGNRKSTADESKVLEVMTEIVEQNDGLSVEELTDLVKDAIGKAGFAQTGLKQRVAKLVAGDGFDVKAKKVILVGAAA